MHEIPLAAPPLDLADPIDEMTAPTSDMPDVPNIEPQPLIQPLGEGFCDFPAEIDSLLVASSLERSHLSSELSAAITVDAWACAILDDGSATGSPLPQGQHFAWVVVWLENQMVLEAQTDGILDAQLELSSHPTPEGDDTPALAFETWSPRKSGPLGQADVEASLTLGERAVPCLTPVNGPDCSHRAGLEVVYAADQPREPDWWYETALRPGILNNEVWMEYASIEGRPFDEDAMHADAVLIWRTVEPAQGIQEWTVRADGHVTAVGWDKPEEALQIPLSGTLELTIDFDELGDPRAVTESL